MWYWNLMERDSMEVVAFRGFDSQADAHDFDEKFFDSDGYVRYDKYLTHVTDVVPKVKKT